MKVLLRQSIAKLGQIGEVVEVRPGYARNYLIPQGLAVEPTQANIKAIEAARAAYLKKLSEERSALELRAKEIDGKEITITARANEEGHLYGSVGPAQIAAALTNEGLLIEADNVILDEPITKLDRYEVPIRLAQDISATVMVWVVPPADSEKHPSDDQGDNPAPVQQDDSETN